MVFGLGRGGPLVLRLAVMLVVLGAVEGQTVSGMFAHKNRVR